MVEVLEPKIFQGKVSHSRIFPKVNSFNYGIYYFIMPLHKIIDGSLNDMLAIDKKGYISFNQKDHGQQQPNSLQAWFDSIMTKHGLAQRVKYANLMAMPRVMGYVFNPVSFWFCYDDKKALIAVLCEVNNTFNQKHCYLCYKQDGSQLSNLDIFSTKKIFHVSPFLKREGSYRFKFDLHAEKMSISINYYDADGTLQLVTALNGRLSSFSRQNIRRCFYSYPLITLKAILLIHWQALKLFIKGVKYIPKPPQEQTKVSLACLMIR